MSSSTRCLRLLEKCKNMKQLKQTHAQMITCGIGTNTYAVSRLMNFCSDPHHGSLSHAFQLFQRIEQPTICIYNTMIKAFLRNGELTQTIEMYCMMLRERFYPDNYTLPYVLQACGYLQSCRVGGKIHGDGLKLGLVSDIFVGNTLIFMYSACGSLAEARKLFDGMPMKTVVSWNVIISGYAKQGDIDNARLLFDDAPVKDRGIWGSMISGYVQNNCFKEGLLMFRLMQSSNLEPDEAVFVSALCACGHLGALDIGIWVHRYLDRKGLPLSLRVNTALVDMYARCGNLDLAKRIFYDMEEKDPICWNVMISGLAMHGDGVNAFKLFMDMEKAGVRPNDITFIAIFTAFSYSDMSIEGLHMFNRMATEYGIEPKSEHYICVVDLLNRAGLFHEAKEIIERMSNSVSPPYEAIAWRSLLSGCYDRGETQLAEVAAQRLFELERHSGAYVLLSNMYAASGKHCDAKMIRKKMKDKKVEKVPGSSSIEVNGFVHEFIARETTHPQMEDICKLLEKMSQHLESLKFIIELQYSEE